MGQCSFSKEEIKIMQRCLLISEYTRMVLKLPDTKGFYNIFIKLNNEEIDLTKKELKIIERCVFSTDITARLIASENAEELQLLSKKLEEEI